LTTWTGDRIGLIVFAGDAFVQLPVTTDYVSAKVFLNSINTGSVPRQGTALGQAILTGIRSYSLDTPESRALILITDGETTKTMPLPLQGSSQPGNTGSLHRHRLGIRQTNTTAGRIPVERRRREYGCYQA
jgi:Mg-chelatase subunit ChlD